MFKRRKRVPARRFGPRVVSKETQGLFKKISIRRGMGISWPLDRRWSARIRQKGEREGAGGRRGGGRRRRAMNGGEKVAGVGGYGATVRGFQLRKHREIEEGEANPPMTSTRPGRGPRDTLHGRRPWSSPVSVARALGSPETLGKRTRRERERRVSSPAR